MKRALLKTDLLLFTASVIWGFAFVAQRKGMEFIGPWSFNAARFSLGSLFILLLLLKREQSFCKIFSGLPSFGWLITGFALFIASSLQQCGIVFTTSGKAGFITGLYVVIVPLLGIFIRHKTNIATWIGAFLSAAGLYLLTINSDFKLITGDLLVLGSAFFWAIHVLLVDYNVKKSDYLLLAFYQYSLTAILSLGIALFSERISSGAMLSALPTIGYAGIFSVGVAFTLQARAQRDAHPAHAAIILSLEAVVALLGGWMILNESLSGRALLGCSLMLTGMIVSQIYLFKTGKRPAASVK
ncbi:MAG: DMT family transporter [Candidatus Cloacimonetes bacterium]|nr:DMT family transporter [Candidatus Cloacimonadota bacterium]